MVCEKGATWSMDGCRCRYMNSKRHLSMKRHGEGMVWSAVDMRVFSQADTLFQEEAGEGGREAAEEGGRR